MASVADLDRFVGKAVDKCFLCHNKNKDGKALECERCGFSWASYRDKYLGRTF